MTLVWKEATPADLHGVLSDLSDLSAGDLNGLPWWKALTVCRDLLDEPDGQVVALFRDSQVLAVFGHHFRTRDVRTTWFLTNTEFARSGASATIACRKYLKLLRNLHPEWSFTAYTRSRHPDCHRWFELLGFRYTGLANDGSLRFVVWSPSIKSDLVGNG